MAFFTPNEDLPQRSFIPMKLLREEPWGEIWQALDRASATNVLLIAYCTPDGDGLFGEVVGGLERWKEVAGSVACPHLLRILEISESAIPYVLVEDPGGPSLRDYVAALKEPINPETAGRMGLHFSQAVLEAEAHDCRPVGLTPDSLYVSPGDRDHPWKVAPIFPRFREQARLVAGGRYLPPEFRTSSSPAKLHADIYTIPLLIADTWRRDFETPTPPLKEVVPLKALCYLLENTMKPVQGAYCEPNVAHRGFERWLQKQAKADMEQWEAAERDRRRGPLLNFFVKRGKMIAGVAAALIGFAGGFMGIQWYLNSRPAKPTAEVVLLKTNAADVATLYLRAIEQSNPALARDLGPGDLVEQTTATLELLESLRQQGRAGTLANIRQRMGGVGDNRIVEASLLDTSGRTFGLLAIDLRQRANAEWYVQGVFLKQAGR